MMIEIRKWDETFESADTRKRQRLKSFYCPSGTDSKGMLNLLCHFPRADALAALGVFLIFCQYSATLPQKHRGKLLHSDSSPMSVDFLSKLLRIEICHLHAALQILSDERVNWVILHHDFDQSAGNLPVICQSSPGFVQGEGEGEESPIVPLGDGQLFPEQEMTKARPRRHTQSQMRRIKVERNTEVMEAIGGWFGRREGTLWTLAEAQALAEINPSKDELRVMQEFYLAPVSANDWRRKSVMTLLNNWASEMDRALAYANR